MTSEQEDWKQSDKNKQIHIINDLQSETQIQWINNKKNRNQQIKHVMIFIFILIIILLAIIGISKLTMTYVLDNRSLIQQKQKLENNYSGLLQKSENQKNQCQDQLQNLKQKWQNYTIKIQPYKNKPFIASTKDQQSTLISSNNLQAFIDLQPPIVKSVKTPQKPAYFPNKIQLRNLDNKKDLIIVTHAGRQKYLSLLYKHLSKQTSQFLQWHLWVRTQIKQDLEFMDKLAKQNSWIKLIKLDPLKSLEESLMYFYKHDCLQKKIYLKLDDDVLWIEPDFVKNMFAKRQKLSQYFLVFPNIINSGIHAYLQQRGGAFKYPQTIQYDSNGNGWKKPMIGVALHKQFIESIEKSDTQKWKRCFNEWEAVDYERISINAMIYYSQTIRSLQQLQSPDDQYMLSQLYPLMYQRKNIILGDILCVHGAFVTQRRFFDANFPQIYQAYKRIAQK